MKRVLVAAMAHESNSFNPIIAGEKDFQVLRGEDVIRRRASNDALTGILNTLEAAGYTPVPTLFVSAVPNGLVDRQFYDRVRSEILSIARQEQEIKTLEAQMEAAGADYARFLELTEEKTARQGELDALYERWEDLAGRVEASE